MDRTAKLDLIARFESAVDPLVELVRTAPAAAVDFRPALPGAWTLREHAAHFLDAEAFAHSRLRTTVAEPGTSVQVWDEEVWQGKARYDSVEALAALEVARSLRKITSTMVRALLDTDWNTHHVHHAKRGRMTLADLLRLYVDHAHVHAQYVRRNLEAYRSQAR
jgi:hypothetical protein